MRSADTSKVGRVFMSLSLSLSLRSSRDGDGDPHPHFFLLRRQFQQPVRVRSLLTPARRGETGPWYPLGGLGDSVVAGINKDGKYRLCMSLVCVCGGMNERMNLWFPKYPPF